MQGTLGASTNKQKKRKVPWKWQWYINPSLHKFGLYKCYLNLGNTSLWINLNNEKM